MTGRAIVKVGGSTYLAERCEYDGNAITFKGRLRVRDLAGERLYAERTITIPIGRVDRIEWLAETPQAASPPELAVVA